MPDYNVNVNKHKDYICNTHKLYDRAAIYPLSPCRTHCVVCKNKPIHVYTIQNQFANQFVYFYI